MFSFASWKRSNKNFKILRKLRNWQERGVTGCGPPIHQYIKNACYFPVRIMTLDRKVKRRLGQFWIVQEFGLTGPLITMLKDANHDKWFPEELASPHQLKTQIFRSTASEISKVHNPKKKVCLYESRIFHRSWTVWNFRQMQAFDQSHLHPAGCHH